MNPRNYEKMEQDILLAKQNGNPEEAKRIAAKMNS